ncbi:MAG: hypothetical protein IIA87_03530 [Nanoarchaeota archaeon]|nr:hypothetical protein [Nanoarchaeota archaeon]
MDLKKEKCEICGTQATSIIRTIITCGKCFSILTRENSRLFKKDLDIPNDLSYRKNCGYYPCEKKFMSKIMYINGEIIKEFCSDTCKEKDSLIKLRKNT